jgi:PAS domain S-box-containing protein
VSNSYGGDCGDVPAQTMAAGVSLADILDAPAIQAMMNAFFALTQISIGVIDLRGNVLVSTGWQDICTKFHRQHPETCLHCAESDNVLSAGVKPGSFKQYRCKNGLWNIATPLFVDGKKVGNLFLSQFLFANEMPDYGVFRHAARRYGFDETEYLAALDRVPRWSQQTVEQAMAFYIPFANLVSTLGVNNARLEQAVTMRTVELTAVNEELIAQNEEITAMNEEIASLNQNLTGLNEELEQRVAERTADLMAAHQEILGQYQAQRRSAETQTALRELTEAVNFATSANELYATVYRLLNKVLPTHNLNIALVDEETAEIVVPYYVAELDVLPRRRPMGKGLTEYTIAQDRTVSLSETDIEQLYQTGEVALRFVKLNHWVGLPLKNSTGKTFGVLSIFSIKDESVLYDDAIKILRIVATQLSMALERRQALDAMAESEARYRSVLEQSPEAVLIIDTQTGNVIEANARFSERFGYELAVHGTLNLFDLIVDAPDTVRSNIDRITQFGCLPVERRLIKHRNGCIVSVERSAALVNYRGQSLSVMTIRDVSEEVRREQEIRRDAQLATRVQMAMLSAPKASEYLDIATVYQPLTYVGGDLFFMDWRYGGKLLRGFLVDATGHGLSTALQTSSLHVLIREVNELDLPLSDAMRWLNRRAAEYFDEGTLAGALGFEIDLDIRQLRWVCAGIPKIMVATKTQQGTLECPGMCLGINEEETFDTHSIPINIGDSLYFMTDGMVALLDSRSELPLELFSAMVSLLDTLSKSENSRDDATAVSIHVRSLPQALVRQDGWPRILRFNGYGDYQRLKGEVGKILAEVTGKPHSLQEVSVHEALANAMECRDGVQRQHKARLRFNKVGHRLIVRVKTSRLGFAGNAILRRLRSQPENMFAFGEDASMGRGIPMMLSMADRMTYNSEGTELLLAWKL